MGPFYYPPPRFEARLVFEGQGFFAPCPNVGGKAKLLHYLPHCGVVIPFVQTQPLGLLRRHGRTLNHDTTQGRLDQLHVRPIGSRDHQAEGHAVRFGQHAALDALLGPIRGIGAGFFPPLTAPSSGRRPGSTNSSLRRVTRQSVPLPPATALETPPRRPSTESGHERSNGVSGHCKAFFPPV